MDPQAFGNWLSGEIAVASHVSFWVAVGVVGFVIWRAMEWRYGGVIARLKDQLEHAESGAAKAKMVGDRRVIREQLGEFLERGVMLQGQTADQDQPPPEAEAQAWYDEVLEYLGRELDKSFVARIGDASCVPPVYTSVPEGRAPLWGGLRIRIYHLQQFIRELA